MNNRNGRPPNKITIGKFMHDMTDGLHSRERWKGKTEAFHRRQSVLHHTLEALILAKVIIDLELKHGNPCGINPYRILGMVIVHDMAERHLDDVIQPIKCARPRIRELYEELEFELFMAMAGELPDALTEGLVQSFKDAVDATGGQTRGCSMRSSSSDM